MERWIGGGWVSGGSTSRGGAGRGGAGRDWISHAVCLMLLASAGFARQVVETASQTPPTATARIEPGALTFPAEAVGSQSPPQTITLTDSGNADLQITDILISGIDFAQANSCGDRLSPGASCSINVTCKPAILGQRLGTISIVTSDPGSPRLLPLTGTGR